MTALVLMVLLQQGPSAPPLPEPSTPPLLAVPADPPPRREPTPAATTPASRRKTSPLTVIGLSVVAVGLAAQTVDATVSTGVLGAALGAPVLGAIPVAGSALFAFGSLTGGPLTPFGTRAFVFFGMQAAGALLALIGGLAGTDEEPTKTPAVALVPVQHGALVQAGWRF